ncbi:uncharacterized FAD-linked oxidoreductase ARB_02478 [Selaginella moellendorffii]|nr:uncharacterized FAD-linked oxidoreductase ARB_02478 [Selaginella moellendorffii]|eukprot:XP_002961034.2 uncharacterized FAD-linked oxidoreductase ARB_02478 [Selaginella moellendorffii]
MGFCGGVLLVVLTVLLASSMRARPTAFSCKCLPSDDCWPDSSAWQALNASIDGQLVASKPPAWPCHEPEYNALQCLEVTQKWSDAFWRAAQPGAMQDSFFEMDGNEGCLLSGNKTSSCYQGRVSVFAVNVSSASHVQRAVEFAATYNLRVTVKNTGHDYLGRSNAAGSLSIWTHHLKDISFVEEFVPEGCNSSAARSGVTIGAGVVWEELYRAADAHGKAIAGAQCSSVGAAGGYPQAAGHSPLSPKYGLSADNVLQYKVVTADGKLVVANACQNKDLFWALRGGGGGTFGVVVSVTHATHPALKSLQFASYVVGANTSESFELVVTEFVKSNPGLSQDGWGGFFLIAKRALIVQYLLPDKNSSFAQSSFDPFLSEARGIAGVSVNGAMQSFSSYLKWHEAVQCSKSGCSFATGSSELLVSRLIPSSTFSDDPEELAQTLVGIWDEGYDRVMGYLTAGGEVSVARDNAVNPAWREALWHIIVVKLFPANETQAAKKSLARAITKTGGRLRRVAPSSGCYLNEADVNEPDWQQAFFGDKYDKLKLIKEAVDPQGLFVCKKCVGSEDWSEDLTCRSKKKCRA